MHVEHKNTLRVSLATRHAEVRAAQALRFKVFAEEMGAHLPTAHLGLDIDEFDAFCHHLLVRDTTNGEIVAYTRILTDARAKRAGRFYSETEFDMRAVRKLRGRVMEVGRTCVHPAYRNGAAIAVLWSGLAQFMEVNRFDYLLGCASVPLQTHDIGEIYHSLASKYLAPEHMRVTPRCPLPAGLSTGRETGLPPLLKAYMRLGAQICGEPCWDEDFNVADIFILLKRDQLNPRYVRHFLGQRDPAFRLRHFPLPYPGYPGRRNVLSLLSGSIARLMPLPKRAA